MPLEMPLEPLEMPLEAIPSQPMTCSQNYWKGQATITPWFRRSSNLVWHGWLQRKIKKCCTDHPQNVHYRFLPVSSLMPSSNSRFAPCCASCDMGLLLVMVPLRGHCWPVNPAPARRQ